MIRLAQALQAWAEPDFERVFKAEVLAMAADRLPLQQALRHGSYALDEPLQLSVLGVKAHPGYLRVQLGVHFQSVIAGCQCADDPGPMDTLAEYCTLQVDIDRQTAVANIRLVELDSA